MYTKGNVKDNRYRPDFESSLRRVREDAFDEEAPLPVWSNELSFVPGRRKELAAHDLQTQALIHEQKYLESLPHGLRLLQLVQDWRVMDRMQGAREKQEHLERAIAAVRRDRESNEHMLLFLMIALEPIRGSVSNEFRRAREGLEPRFGRSLDQRREQQDWLAHHADQQAIEDVTRNAVIEAIYHYPETADVHLFPWFRDTIAHRAISALMDELPQMKTSDLAAVEADAMVGALEKLQVFDAPLMNDLGGFGHWRTGIDARELYETVEEFHRRHPARRACERAVNRLAPRQRETINALFFEDISPEELAERRGVSRSTIDNTKAQATVRLHGDDVFFVALHRLGAVRDAARDAELRRRYPDGVLPDGRRIVSMYAHAA